MTTIPIEQRSPHPGGKRRASAAPSVPDDQAESTANSARGPPRLWDRETTLNFFGGIDVSTLYRGMREGRYPRPINISSNLVRWLGDECEEALQRMIGERNQPKPIKPRGRKTRKRIT